MKKAILFVISVMLMLTGCYDDSALVGRVTDLEDRVQSLEELCEEMNTNISSLQIIVAALEQNDYITSVTPIKRGEESIGYTLVFAKSGAITIYNGQDGIDGTPGKDGADGTPGKDGIDGAPGQDGAPGHTPVIGVKKDVDEVYYWTIDGEWLLDDNGLKVRASGLNGEDGAPGKDGVDGAPGKDGIDGVDGTPGQDGAPGTDGQNGRDGVTPKLKIEDGYWYVSYEDGAEGSWQQLGKATGEDGENGETVVGESVFASVDTSDPSYVVFNLVDGTQISIPTWAAFAELKAAVQQLNTNIEAMQSILTAWESGDYITSVSPLVESGLQVGYTISFAKAGAITLYYGKDGADGTPGKDGVDGAPGQDGAPGHTPVIGVKKDVDQVYYWTIDGEWLLDDNGLKVRASGQDGKDGQDGAPGKDGVDGTPGKDGIDGVDGTPGQDGAPGTDGQNGRDGVTPKLKIEDGYWYVSYEDGAEGSWQQLGKATGEDGEDGESVVSESIFKSVDLSDPDCVVFKLSDDTQISIPTWAAFAELKAAVQQLNTNIEAMQSILAAWESNDWITGVSPLMESGAQVGYTISFAKAGTITLYHGKDGADGTPGKDGVDGAPGQDGTPGQDGAPGHTPVIGVKKDVDEVYYWTIDGEWLLDDNGLKVRASGQDGAPGKDGVDGKTPQLKIEDGYWYVSYDGQEPWVEYGKATGDKGDKGDSFFKSVVDGENSVVLTLADETVIEFQKLTPFSILFDVDGDVRFSLGQSYYIGYTLNGVDESASLSVIASDGLSAKVEKTDELTGNIIVTIPSSYVERSTVAVLLSDGYGRMYMRALNFVYEGSNNVNEAVFVVSSGTALSIGAEGGNLDVPVQTNLNYIVEVPESSREWISFVKTRAVREEVIELSVAANTGARRYGFVYALDPADRRVIQTLCIAQDGDSEFLGEEVTFVDPDFEAYMLTNYDVDGDGKLTRTEAELITALSIAGKKFVDLSGIEYLTNLEVLDCSSNKLSVIDLKANKALRELDCGGNTSVTTLDLSKNLALEKFTCTSASLTMLDLSSNKALEYVNCASSSTLSGVVLGTQDNLTNLNFSGCALTSLDVSKCPQLQVLNLTSNPLAKLDLSSNYQLSSLYVNSTKITDINLGSIPYITSLDLTRPYPSENFSVKVRGTYLRKFTINHSGSNSTSYHKLHSVDLDGCINLEEVTLGTCNFSVIDLTDLPKLKSVKILTGTSMDSARLLLDNSYALEVLEVAGDIGYVDLSKHSALKSVEFTQQTSFAELDLSAAAGLQSLKITATNKWLESLDLSNNKSVSTIDIRNASSLETLDLDGCVSLSDLTLQYCDSFSQLNLGDCKSLSSMTLYSLPLLSSVDFSDLESLASIKLNNVQIRAVDLSDLSMLSSVTILECLAVSTINLSGTKVRTFTLGSSNSTAKPNNVAVKVISNELEEIKNYRYSVDVTGCPALKVFTATRCNLGNLDLRQNKFLNSVSCASCGVTGLLLPETVTLKSLSCPNNSIVSLDLTPCPGLETVSAYSCSIQSLVVNNNPQLKTLTCYDNYLKELDLRKSTVLTSLDCSPMTTLEKVILKTGTKISMVTYDRVDTHIPEQTLLEYVD